MIDKINKIQEVYLNMPTFKEKIPFLLMKLGSFQDYRVLNKAYPSFLLDEITDVFIRFDDDKQLQAFLKDNNFGSDFSNWLWELYIDFGFIVARKMEYSARPYDWETFTIDAVIAQSNPLRGQITRYDDQQFIIESSRTAWLTVVGRIFLAIKDSIVINKLEENEIAIISKLFCFLEELKVTTEIKDAAESEE